MSYVVQREDRFDFLSEEYADLHTAAGGPAFQHGVWLHRLYATLAPARDARPVVVTVRSSGTAELLLVLPLVSTGRLVRTLTFADLGVADYNCPVADPAVLQKLIQDGDVAVQVRQALGRFDLLQVDRVAGAADAVAGLLHGSRVRRHHYDTHMVALPSTTDSWHESLDPKFVRHLERKYKRLRPRGERVLRTVTEVSDVEALMSVLRSFRAARFAERPGTDLVQDEATYAFYRAVAEDSVQHGGPVRLAVLEIGGEPVAIAFDLVEPERELFLLVGYDLGRLRNYSLGLLIVHGLALEAIDRGVPCFDLTVGDESYKADFGAHRVPLFQVRVARSARGRVAMVVHDLTLWGRQQAKRQLLASRERRAARTKDVDSSTK